uniref:Uncharacterized protein n=1 Tax=Nelumbo nucifera TaxID=4432 RepID=A0A822ZFC7_NELNU|nr:TPA_asm: hypothetical protein HUJ06_001493 [Nelumbo nucifera]
MELHKIDQYWISLFLTAIILTINQTAKGAGAEGIGVNYGLLADNIPPPESVVAFLKSKNIQKVRLFDPNQNVLTALRGSGLDVVIGVGNEDIERLANDMSFAASWIMNNVAPHIPNVNFKCIAVGNEVSPDSLLHVTPAMKNLDAALKAINHAIPVSTAIEMRMLSSSYPPSSGAFSSQFMADIVAFLAANSYPLLANVYPYYGYDPKYVRLEYAMFTAREVVVQDGPYGYKNLFDAMVDSLYWALEKVGGNTVKIIVTECGWPSAGNGDIATIENARTFNNNLIAHVLSNSGTPKRPGQNIETYIFALFNEDLKAVGFEQHWGLFYPNTTEVYPVNFSPQ